jgi:hypothetical protein
MIERFLLAITGAIIIASIWMTSERHQKPPHQENTTGLSADFVALIRAIRNENVTNREDGRAQEIKRWIREGINTLVLAITCVAIIYQVHEMQKAYLPISDAAQTARDTERRQLSAFITVNDVRVDKTINDNKEFIHATLVPIIENDGQTPAREVIYQPYFTSATGPLAPDRPARGQRFQRFDPFGRHAPP